MVTPQFLPDHQALQSRVETCSYCMKMCRFACPVAEASKHEAHTPFGKVEAFFHSIQQGQVLIQDKELASLVYYCTNCGLCNSHCKHENQVEEVLSNFRHRLFSEQKVPLDIAQAADRVKRLEAADLEYFQRIIETRSYDQNCIYFEDLKAGQVVLVPDYAAFRHKHRRVMKLLKGLQRVFTDVKILRTGLENPFSCYQAGDFSSVLALARKLKEKSGVRFIFENEHMFYGYNTLPARMQADFSESEKVMLAANELSLEIKLKNFQFQPGSVALRLAPQAYVTKLGINYPGLVTPLPGSEYQQPVSDSQFFRESHPGVHKKMVENKWQELLDRPGDIVCAVFTDYQALAAQNKKEYKRNVYYYYDFVV